MFLLPYSPELQPAEHLWPLIDEPVVNRLIRSLNQLEAILRRDLSALGAEGPDPLDHSVLLVATVGDQ